MNKIFSLCASFLISFIAAAQVPANDDCSNAVLLTPSINSFCATTTAGTTVDATARYPTGQLHLADVSNSI